MVKSYCTIPARRCLTTKQGIVRGRGGTVRNIWRHLSLRSGQSHIPEHLYIFVVLFTSNLLVLFPLLFFNIYFYLDKGGHLSLYTNTTLFKPLLLALVLPCIGSPSAQFYGFVTLFLLHPCLIILFRLPMYSTFTFPNSPFLLQDIVTALMSEKLTPEYGVGELCVIWPGNFICSGHALTRHL